MRRANKVRRGESIDVKSDFGLIGLCLVDDYFFAGNDEIEQRHSTAYLLFFL